MTQSRSNDESGMKSQNIDESVSRKDEDVFALPPRREVHKRASTNKATGKVRKKQKRRIRFPLVRIWLFLFLILVGLMVAYPIWLDQ